MDLSLARCEAAFRAAEGGAYGLVAFTDGQIHLGLKSTRRAGCLRFENADAHGILDVHAQGGFTVEVSARAIFLATHVLEDAIAMADDIAAAFGAVADSRIRRVDLAADFAAWPLDDIGRRAWVGQRRATVGDVVECFDSGASVRGFRVCPGNPIHMRVYDKLAELVAHDDEAKRAAEEELWRRAGREDDEPVSRIEFQLRSRVLDELSLRDTAQLAASLDRVWQYCVRWVRLAIPGNTNRRTRWKTDPRWDAVRAVVFERVSNSIAPLRRG